MPDIFIGHPNIEIYQFPLKDCGNDICTVILPQNYFLGDKFFTSAALAGRNRIA